MNTYEINWDEILLRLNSVANIHIFVNNYLNSPDGKFVIPSKTVYANNVYSIMSEGETVGGVNYLSDPVVTPNAKSLPWLYQYANFTNENASWVCPESLENAFCLFQRSTIAGAPSCGNNVTNAYAMYAKCDKLSGNPVVGSKVVNAAFMYDSSSVSGEPAISHSIRNMYSMYTSCSGITGNAVFSDNATNTKWAYGKTNITNPCCTDTTTDLSCAFANCFNLTGAAVCGSNVINMCAAYQLCNNMECAPVCGPNVEDFSQTYTGCAKLVGPAVCGDKVTTMLSTYIGCSSLTGAPACGPNVKTMTSAYQECVLLEGPPVCGPNVEDMNQAYTNCFVMTGSPVCGDKVTSLSATYLNCKALTGRGVCGPEVTSMYATYAYTKINSADIGPKVTDTSMTFLACTALELVNIYGMPNNAADKGTYSFYWTTKLADIHAYCPENYRSEPQEYCNWLNGYITNAVCSSTGTKSPAVTVHVHNVTLENTFPYTITGGAGGATTVTIQAATE